MVGPRFYLPSRGKLLGEGFCRTLEGGGAAAAADGQFVQSLVNVAVPIVVKGTGLG